jgi:hypothetical protein
MAGKLSWAKAATLWRNPTSHHQLCVNPLSCGSMVQQLLDRCLGRAPPFNACRWASCCLLALTVWPILLCFHLLNCIRGLKLIHAIHNDIVDFNDGQLKNLGD